MTDNIVLDTIRLGFPWQTADPFLFCVHHLDAYPPGNAQMGPAASLAGRRIGMDFDLKDGWRMYHGDVVPGFPRHPHRGFETITIARQGLIDHADSMGATARFGHGDVQWMTAGAGVVHSEMFPLVNAEAPNTAELFQIWLNLPRRSKLTDPHFTMFWSHTVPRRVTRDGQGRATTLTLIAGALDDLTPPTPPPGSWASDPAADVAIWTLKMDPGATFTLPPAAAPDANRTLYAFQGQGLKIGGSALASGQGALIRADLPAPLTNGPQESELLMLQGRPIGEPVAQHGPFVMNSQAEIQQAFRDYQRTGFGGWPWPDDGPVHPRDSGRFAIHADGSE